MKHTLFLLVLILLATACGRNTEKRNPTPSLTFRWQTDTRLRTCESVMYDKEKDVLYVSCINGNPSVKDGNGFIAEVNMDGSISHIDFTTGLNAPKGMGIVDNHLFVADIDRVVEVDTHTGEIEHTYSIDSAKFLNDIVTSTDGKVYVSDTNGNKVYVLDGSSFHPLFDINGPNGLQFNGDDFIVAEWNKAQVSTVDLSSGKAKLLADSIPNPDGVEAVGNGDLFVSSWNGMVRYVRPDGSSPLILDTTSSPDSIGAADIKYIPEKKLLLVPTFYGNRVMAYDVIQ